MPGITRSVITMAGRNVVTFSSASTPSAAESATNPQLLTSCSRPTRAAESSSTTSTRSAAAAWVSRPSSSITTGTADLRVSFLHSGLDNIALQAQPVGISDNYATSAEAGSLHQHGANAEKGVR